MNPIDIEFLDVESDLGPDEILSAWRRKHAGRRGHRLRHIIDFIIHHHREA